MFPKSPFKFTASLTLALTMIFVIFSLPVAVKGQELDSTPSQPPKTNTQTLSTETPISTNSLTPTNTSIIPHHTPNTQTITPSHTNIEKLPTGTPTLTSTIIPTENLPSGNYVDDEALIKLKTHEPSQDFLNDLKSLNAVIKTELSDLSVVLVKIPAGSVPAFIANIKLSQDVVYAEPNYLMSIADTIPNDGGWGLQYGPAAIRAPQGWDLSTGSSAITIAVIDTGIDQSHPDLAAKIVPGYDFANDDNNPQDDNGHGTHVAGIAAASANNGLGIAGISWGARLMPVKVLNASGNGSYANAAAGIIWAADNGAQVINMSFGGAAPSTTLDNAIIYAYGKGVTIVAAAGNSGSNSLLYPARYPEVIAVAATDSSNTRASFSNYGPEMSVSAPGVSIYSSLPGGSYGYLSGTSMSAPMVSGAAAVLAGLPGNNNPASIAWELQTSALDLGAPGFDSFYGYGLIQLDGAIRLALPITPTPTTTLTFTPTPSPTATFLVTLTTTITLTASPTMNMTPTVSASPTLTSTMSRTPIFIHHESPTPRLWVSFPPVFFFITATPTITPTLTTTSTAALLLITRMVSLTSTQLILDKSGEIQTQENSADDSLLLPCSGILFILAGLVLAYIAFRSQHHQS